MSLPLDVSKDRGPWEERVVTPGARGWTPSRSGTEFLSPIIHHIGSSVVTGQIESETHHKNQPKERGLWFRGEPQVQDH